MTCANRKARDGRVQRFLEVEISPVKSIAIQNEPAQHRIKLASDCLNTAAQPWQPGVCPSGPYMKHIDMLFAWACHEFCQTAGATGDGVQQSNRHSRAFISKAAKFQSDLLESAT